MTTEANKQVILDLIAAANDGDLTRIAAAYADDYTDHTLGGSRREGHREATLEAFREILAAFPDTQHMVDDVIAEGDRVVVRLRASGTQSGPFRGTPASGRRVTMSTTAIYRLREGLIVERWCDGASAIRDHLERLEREAAPRDAVRVLRGATAAWQRDASGAEFQELRLPGVSLTRFRVPPAAAFPEHAHASEQITLVLEGELIFGVNDARHVVGPGDAIAIPGGVSHAVEAGDAPVDALDAWSPPPSHLGPAAR